MSFADAVAEFPMDRINAKPANCPYSFWHLVEHIRITQWDIVEFVVDPKHKSPRWPEGYRPRPDAKTDEAGWAQSVGTVLADLDKLKKIVSDPSTDFFGPIPHAPGYTVFREVRSPPTTTPITWASWRSCGKSRACGPRAGSTLPASRTKLLSRRCSNRRPGWRGGA